MGGLGLKKVSPSHLYAELKGGNVGNDETEEMANLENKRKQEKTKITERRGKSRQKMEKVVRAKIFLRK